MLAARDDFGRQRRAVDCPSVPKNPLFSSYRTGENRVTASIIAVLERVDIGVVERLLSAATGEANLPLVSFVNQVAATDGSVPDAGIYGNFRYLFEVKTTARALNARQLEEHLAHLDGSFANERLFVLTSDPEEPSIVTQLGEGRLAWLNFQGLDQAIHELLQDEAEMLAEQTRFLLHELCALFAQEGLLGQEDTVVVAARDAYPEYRKTAVYACQPGRAFREGVRRMGFYYGGAIQPEVPLIRHRWDGVSFSSDNVAALRATGDCLDAELATLIERLLDESPRVPGQQYQVFLLSPTDDEQTLRLAQPVENTTKDRTGKPWAWTMGQRYTQSRILEQSPDTTSELERLGG
jgi:hypothetical protein